VAISITLVVPALRPPDRGLFAAPIPRFTRSFIMPLVRISVSDSRSNDDVRTISEVIYQAMLDVANVPEHDKFQIIHRHAAGDLVYPSEGYLGIQYTPSIVFIQVTWNAGRTVDVKKRFYKAVAEGISRKTGTRIEDVWINLIDVQPENWSFGNGEMQYAPKTP
jgi:phenylpyruvate tautomerase PptA (4-oxalocrotonate tautomerase family)